MIDILALVATVTGSLLVSLPKLFAVFRVRRAINRAGHPMHEMVTPEILARESAEQRTLLANELSESRTRRSAKIVLGVFLTILIIFSLATAWRYWPQIQGLSDRIYLAVGLLLTMLAGMLVQVTTTNYGEGRGLLDVTPSRLIYPLLFSPIVFYPIWLVGDKPGAAVFSFYAAFLNGYFWQSVVSGVKHPPAASGGA